MIWLCGFDSSSSGQTLVAGFYENCRGLIKIWVTWEAENVLISAAATSFLGKNLLHGDNQLKIMLMSDSCFKTNELRIFILLVRLSSPWSLWDIPSDAWVGKIVITVASPQPPEWWTSVRALILIYHTSRWYILLWEPPTVEIIHCQATAS
jgi:hypothetical protein